MARRLEEQYAHGSYAAEYVHVVPPLGEDRKPISVPDIDVVKMAEMNSRTPGLVLGKTLAPLDEKYGVGVWETGRHAIYEVGRRRAAGMLTRHVLTRHAYEARLRGTLTRHVLTLHWTCYNLDSLRGCWVVSTGKVSGHAAFDQVRAKRIARYVPATESASYCIGASTAASKCVDALN